jgi:hypothetical protein
LRGSPGLALAGVVAGAAGFVGAVGSLVGEYAQRVHELAQGRPYYVLREPKDPSEADPR